MHSCDMCCICRKNTKAKAIYGATAPHRECQCTIKCFCAEMLKFQVENAAGGSIVCKGLGWLPTIYTGNDFIHVLRKWLAATLLVKAK